MDSSNDQYIVIQKFGKDDENRFGKLYLVEKEEKGIKKAFMKKVLKDNLEDSSLISLIRKLFDEEINIINKLIIIIIPKKYLKKSIVSKKSHFL